MNPILLVDDMPEVLDMLGRAVSLAFPEAHQIHAHNLTQAQHCLQKHTFSLALIDLMLGDGNGQTLIAQLAQQQPQCAVVVATIFDDDDNLFGALQAGAQGYLLKDQAPELLVRQLQGMSQGLPPLSPAIARRLLRHFQYGKTTDLQHRCELSEREREVLGLLAKGIRITDIAQALGISRFTVGDHVKNIYRKLNICSRAEAALQAQRLGLI